MHFVRTTPRAELLHLKPLRGFLLVLRSAVIPALALGARQSNDVSHLTRYLVVASALAPRSYGGQPSPCYLACQPKLAQRAKAGADDRDRTGDLVLTKDALCQLSYIGSLRSHVRLHRAASSDSLRPQLACQPKLAPLAPMSVAQVRRGEGWSGRRGSNPRPTAWKAVTLPLSYSRKWSPLCCLCLHCSAVHIRLRIKPRRTALRGSLARQPKPVATAPGLPSRASGRGEGWWGGEDSNLRSR